jgi:hypothetical protein
MIITDFEIPTRKRQEDLICATTETQLSRREQGQKWRMLREH